MIVQIELYFYNSTAIVLNITKKLRFRALFSLYNYRIVAKIGIFIARIFMI